jgi:rare lipoprotein A
MNRLSILAATFVIVANVGAAPVPNHQQPQASKTSPKVTKTARLSRTRPVSKGEKKPYQVGNASWYGKKFYGKTTASGENFDMFELTAAHKQLPLGTFVKVTNLRNNKTVIVRVNDRGPYVGNRIMDLSYSAARMLGFRDGVERVRLDLVTSQTVAANYTVQ